MLLMGELTTLGSRLVGADAQSAEYIKKAEQLQQRISIVHQIRRPFEYQTDYHTLWAYFRDYVESLRAIDHEAVSQFKDKVAARVKQLEIRMDVVIDNWQPDDFDELERMLVCYEKNSDLLAAL